MTLDITKTKNISKIKSSDFNNLIKIIVNERSKEDIMCILHKTFDRATVKFYGDTTTSKIELTEKVLKSYINNNNQTFWKAIQKLQNYLLSYNEKDSEKIEEILNKYIEDSSGNENTRLANYLAGISPYKPSNPYCRMDFLTLLEEHLNKNIVKKLNDFYEDDEEFYRESFKRLKNKNQFDKFIEKLDLGKNKNYFLDKKIDNTKNPTNNDKKSKNKKEENKKKNNPKKDSNNRVEQLKDKNIFEKIQLFIYQLGCIAILNTSNNIYFILFSLFALIILLVKLFKLMFNNEPTIRNLIINNRFYTKIKEKIYNNTLSKWLFNRLSMEISFLGSLNNKTMSIIATVLVVFYFFNLSVYLGLFIILLTLSILGHEAAHLFFMKKSDTKVLEYSLGMGPKLLTVYTDKKGVDYNIRAIPIGGFVKPIDDDYDDKGFFRPNNLLISKKLWQKMLVYSGGALFNIITGFIILITIFSVVGFSINKDNIDIQVNEIVENEEAPRAIKSNQEKDETMKGFENYLEKRVDSVFVGGLNLESENKNVTETKNKAVLNLNTQEGIEEIKNLLLMQYYFFEYTIRTGQYKVLGEEMKSIVGVGKVIYNQEEMGIFEMFPQLFWLLIGLINIVLGVMNLLPIPPLDGYHVVKELILNIAYEISRFYNKIIRRVEPAIKTNFLIKFNKKLRILEFISFIVLLSFMLIVVTRDIFFFKM